MELRSFQQVKWIENVVFKYGRVLKVQKDSVIVEDAIFPTDWELCRKDLIAIEGQYPTEYEKYVENKLKKAIEKTHQIKNGILGCTFSLPVADGRAWYEVIKENKKTCVVEWRGYGVDNYTDGILEFGGTFPKKIIKSIIDREKAIYNIFKTDNNNEN